MDIRAITRRYLLKEAFDGFEDTDSFGEDDDDMSQGGFINVNNCDFEQLQKLGINYNDILSKQIYVNGENAKDGYQHSDCDAITCANGFNLPSGITLFIFQPKDIVEFIYNLLKCLYRHNDHRAEDLYLDIFNELPLDVNPNNLLNDNAATEWATTMTNNDSPENYDGWEYNRRTSEWVNTEDPTLTYEDWFENTVNLYISDFFDCVEGSEYMYYIDEDKVYKALKNMEEEGSASEESLINALQRDNLDVRCEKLNSGLIAVTVPTVYTKS